MDGLIGVASEGTIAEILKALGYSTVYEALKNIAIERGVWKEGLKGRQIKPKKKTRAERLGDITNALQNAHSDLEGLAEEVREHADNMTGTNLEHTDRYQILEDAANALEDGASELEEIISTLDGVEFP